MITKNQEIAALLVHILSLMGDCLTTYFNNNMNIKFLSIMDIGQHLTKIIRIIIFGFGLEHSPAWFCYLHSFLNHFTHNSALTLSCFVIFNLYAAIVYPLFFSKYHKVIRPYVYIFTMVYNAIFILIALYEPLFIGYSLKRIENSHNCSSGYRYRLYQYILTSATSNLPFSISAVICTGIIIHKIRITPRKTLKYQLTKRTNISFSRWIKILLMSVIVTLFSFLNLYNDVMNGIAVENGTKYEVETLGSTYYFTASSGILLFVLTNSSHQIKKKLGIKNSTYDLDYKYSQSSRSNYNSRNNSIDLSIKINEKENFNDIKSSTIPNNSIPYSLSSNANNNHFNYNILNSNNMNTNMNHSISNTNTSTSNNNINMNTVAPYNSMVYFNDIMYSNMKNNIRDRKSVV